MSPTSRPIACIALPLDGELRARVEDACDVRWLAPDVAREELLTAVADAEGLLVINHTPVDDALLAAAPKLRVVSGYGVGYDRVDVAAASRRGVAVCNTPDVVTEPVVNLTIALILAASRRLLENAAYTRGGGWAGRERPPAHGVELRGKTLGIVGFGRIGSAVARRIAPFGMDVLYSDPVRPADPGEARYAALEELLAAADFVSLHTDLNPSSRHLIGARELARMKPSAWLVNTARGPVVNQAALTEALRSRRIAGAALDVLEREPPAPDEPLLREPNVIALPHAGTATVETRAAMASLCVDNLLAVIQGEKPPACVNPGVLAP